MNKKIQLIFFSIFMVSGIFAFINKDEVAFSTKNNVTNTINKLVRLSYIVDEKKGCINFSKKIIELKMGDSFVIKTSDLLVGGPIFEYIDVDWKTSSQTEYIFKGIKTGKTRVEFMYTKNSNIRGYIDVIVKNNSAVRSMQCGFKKIFYKKIDDSLTFSETNISIKKGQRIMLVSDPRGEYNGDLIIEGEYSEKLDENCFFLANKSLHVFKAMNTGQAKIECHKAHEDFIKGTININVIN
jgi:hypothetical protein